MSEAKEIALHKALSDGDVNTIRALAITPDGLINQQFRRKAWPLLLGNPDFATLRKRTPEWKQLDAHPDEDQVKLDVARSFVFYPSGLEESEKTSLKQDLYELIVELLRRNRELCYFQGYHDICQVLLLTMGKERALPMMEIISLGLIRDYMLPTMDSVMDLLQLIPPLIEMANDSDLTELVQTTSPIFALSPVMTLFSHDIDNLERACVIFDYFLASRSAGSMIYLSVALLITQKARIKQAATEDTDNNPLHSSASVLFSNPDLNISEAISLSVILSKSHPFSDLQLWNKISDNSALKKPLILALSNNNNNNNQDLKNLQEQAILLIAAQSRELQDRAEKQKATFEKERHKKATSSASGRGYKKYFPRALLPYLRPQQHRQHRLAKMMPSMAKVSVSLSIGLVSVLLSAYIAKHFDKKLY